MNELTVAIVAHNAEQTIARAIRSVRVAGNFPILLVADGCSDRTVAVAEAEASTQMQVIKLSPNRGVGAARDAALQAIDTDFGMWLDADDEILPERPGAMLTALNAGADLAYDGGVLVDGETGETIAELSIPPFMFEKDAELRCFERNWYPILAGGFRVDAARSIGFDASFTCAEDYDFLQRALMAGLRISSVSQTGYRYYHDSSSISRNLSATLKNVWRALSKHSYDELKSKFSEKRFSDVEIQCILAGHAMYRKDFSHVVEYALNVGKSDEILPTYNLAASVYARFVMATAEAKLGNFASARALLQEYLADEQAADGWNNLGVALYHLGDGDGAMEAFRKALQMMPGYLDAEINLTAETPKRITTHPIRRQTSRSDYT